MGSGFNVRVRVRVRVIWDRASMSDVKAKRSRGGSTFPNPKPSAALIITYR